MTSPRLIDIGLTNSYVCKPIDFDEFAEQVRQIGAYWLVVTNRHYPAGRVTLESSGTRDAAERSLVTTGETCANK